MNISVMGLQFGDEGKGNIEFYMLKSGFFLPKGETYNHAVRYHGGANAGESYERDGKIVISHQVPVGVGYRDTITTFLSGGVIHPQRLVAEIKELELKGIHVTRENFRISGKAQVVLLHHLIDEGSAEDGATLQFGTTRSGVATAYAAAARKTGINVAEYVGPFFESHLRDRILPQVEALYNGRITLPSIDEYLEKSAESREVMRQFVAREDDLMKELSDPEAHVILAGCQSVGLDVFAAPNRYSSSSVTTRLPLNVDKRIGVMKLIQSGVGQRRATGNGKWITYDASLSEQLRGTTDDDGIEVGKTSGRPRDLGYFDAVLVKYNIAAAGIDGIAVTKLDRMGKLLETTKTGNQVPICVKYQYKGETLSTMPEDSAIIEECTPVYTHLEIGTEDLQDIEALRRKREFRELSPKTQDFFSQLADTIGAPIDIISTGPYADNKIVRI